MEIQQQESLVIKPLSCNIWGIYIEWMDRKKAKRMKKLGRMDDAFCCVRMFYMQYLLMSEIFIAFLSLLVCVIKFVVRAIEGDICLEKLLVSTVVLYLDMLVVFFVEVLLLLSCCSAWCFTKLYKAIKMVSAFSYVLLIVLIFIEPCSRGYRSPVADDMEALIIPITVLLLSLHSSIRLKELILCNSLDFIRIGLLFLYRNIKRCCCTLPPSALPSAVVGQNTNTIQQDVNSPASITTPIPMPTPEQKV